MQKSKFIIVLAALEAECEIKFPFGTITMLDNVVVIVARKYEPKQKAGEKVYLPFNLELNDFIDACEDLTLTKEALKAAQTTIQKMKVS